MPLTAKGEEILKAMEEQYGSRKKAMEVLYASKNAGKITGIDSGDRITEAASLDAIRSMSGAKPRRV